METPQYVSTTTADPDKQKRSEINEADNTKEGGEQNHPRIVFSFAFHGLIGLKIDVGFPLADCESSSMPIFFRIVLASLFLYLSRL